MSPRHARPSRGAVRAAAATATTAAFAAIGLAAALASCSASTDTTGAEASPTSAVESPTAAASPSPSATASSEASPEPTETASAAPSASPSPSATVNAYARPEWLGATVLEKQENGLGEPGGTPAALRDRQLEPRPGAYPDPEDDAWFAEVSAVPDDVLARSSWRDECPVPPEDLAYIVMPFWGFDDEPHTGEMITSAEHAEAIVTVFEKMYERRFPIEEMRVTTWDEVNGDHTGDQNVTISFECRHVTGGYDRWSQHASGLAIDINPFHNPWRRDGYVFPELARAYLDRDWHRPGMIDAKQRTVSDFEKIGWSWGGNWVELDDWMHFSATNL
ncbi:M15 family metallopeptidase [Demequina mangrovi]|uniref:D-alanyl-D-alanine carboxypeptidase n=1 Tax=Demequina mangrovi TaxID=1043493 RepID=A0A1H6XIA5_9MICO|nr:M15 family metallopeptidase [Demequina mangrovi]SEJ24600.1 D-alanyl-D-alanine carboxypeptidase [Demequina mangrovi]